MRTWRIEVEITRTMTATGAYIVGAPDDLPGEAVRELVARAVASGDLDEPDDEEKESHQETRPAVETADPPEYAVEGSAIVEVMVEPVVAPPPVEWPAEDSPCWIEARRDRWITDGTCATTRAGGLPTAWDEFTGWREDRPRLGRLLDTHLALPAVPASIARRWSAEQARFAYDGAAGGIVEVVPDAGGWRVAVYDRYLPLLDGAHLEQRIDGSCTAADLEPILAWRDGRLVAIVMPCRWDLWRALDLARAEVSP